MKLNMKKVALTSTALVGALALTQPAYAQAVNDGQEETTEQIGNSAIIVTAQKRSEDVQEVPIAIAAFDGDALEDRGLSNLSQITEFTPNVTIDFTSPISGSSASASTFIRGIGQSDFLLTIDPGVGIYVDGVYVARSVGGIVDLLNIERVEILKGPQGTLFGRNTIGGAISIITNEPDDVFGGSVQVTTGRYNRIDAKATINVPIIEDTLLSSFSFSSKNRDGYARRIEFDGPQEGDIVYPFQAQQNATELGNENTDTARATLLWNASDMVTATLRGEYTRSRESAPASTLLATTETAPGALAGAYNALVADAGEPPANGITRYDGRFITGDPFTSYGTGPNFSNLDLYGVSLTVDADLSDSVSLKSITAYRDLDASFGRDGDVSPLTIDHTSNDYQHEQFSQELQLSGLLFEDRMNWLLGAYYFEESGVDRVFVPLGGVPFLRLDETNNVDNTSFAIFGEVKFDLTDRLSIIAGGRWTTETKEYLPVHRDLNAFFSGILPVSAFPDPNDLTLLTPIALLEQDFEDFTPRFVVDYKWSDNFFTYVSYSQGFKSGGWTGRTVDPNTTGPREFFPESATAYEVGFKSDLFGNTLRLNAAAFFTDYTDLQLINQQGITPITVNAGEAEIKGIEVDVLFNPTPGLVFIGAASYTDAEYTSITDPFSITQVTDEFVNTPEFTGSFAIEYTFDLANGGELLARGDVNHTSTVFNNAENTPVLRQDPVTLLNAAIAYTDPGGDWSLRGEVRNITNEIYLVSGFNQPGVGFVEGNFARPREWALTGTFNF